MERLALADAESSSVKAEAELVRDALSLTIENFKDSKNLRIKFLRMDSPPTASDIKMIEMRSKNYI